MKVIGLIGGMSWNSTLEYYRLINEMIATRLGGLHSARIVLYSLDFEEIECAQRQACLRIVEGLRVRGAEGIILGCTELPLLIHPGDVQIPLFDTTRLHAEAAVELALPSKNAKTIETGI